MAVLCALLFAVHPVHVEAVANIVGRAEMLSAGLFAPVWPAHDGLQCFSFWRSGSTRG